MVTVDDVIKSSSYGKDKFDSVFTVAENIMFERPTHTQFVRLIHEVKEMAFSLGDTELLNDCIYHNYNSAVSYFDDDLEKTAFFLDSLSKADNYEKYIRRTQNYELKSV